jgi:hypothetical protein
LAIETSFAYIRSLELTVFLQKVLSLLDFAYREKFWILPGQSRPLVLKLSLTGGNASSARLGFHYIGVKTQGRIKVDIPIRHASLYDPHKFTYLHPSGIVSYGILRPPSVNATCSNPNNTAPVLLALHGAGVDTDGPIMHKAFDHLPNLCAWIVAPSGVTSWSGDDWRKTPNFRKSCILTDPYIDSWCLADASAAIHSLPAWIEMTGWKGFGLDCAKILITGHSNGGLLDRSTEPLLVTVAK